MDLRPTGAVALALALASGPAAAYPDGKWSGFVQFDNDVFDVVGPNTDRFYTHGTHLTVISPKFSYDALPRILRRSGVLEEGAWASWGVALGQDIYTPERARLTADDIGQRPYAGWAYIGPTFLSYSDKEMRSLEIHVGVVGPSARSDLVQNRWHDLINAPRFRGWQNQLKDEVAFGVVAERKFAPVTLVGDDAGPDWRVDANYYYSAALGTVRISGQAGAAIRAGYGLDGDFGPPSIQPSPSGSMAFRSHSPVTAYAFAGFEGRLVGRDIFLDGNTWQDSPRADEKRALTYDVQAGVVGRWGPVWAAYTYVWRSEEFIGQIGNQEFGSISVGLTFDSTGLYRAARTTR